MSDCQAEEPDSPHIAKAGEKLASPDGAGTPGLPLVYRTIHGSRPVNCQPTVTKNP